MKLVFIKLGMSEVIVLNTHIKISTFIQLDINSDRVALLRKLF